MTFGVLFSASFITASVVANLIFPQKEISAITIIGLVIMYFVILNAFIKKITPRNATH